MKKLKLILSMMLTCCMFTCFALPAFAGEEESRYIGLIGDVDMDGRVTIKDATLIQKSLAKLKNLTIDQKTLGAVTSMTIFEYSLHPNKLNIKDATALQKYIAHIPVSEVYNVGKVYFSKPLHLDTKSVSSEERIKKCESWRQIVQDKTFSLGEKSQLNILNGTYFYHPSVGFSRENHVSSYSYQGFGNYPKIDGSTACIPLIGEFALQFLDMTEYEATSFSSVSKTSKAYVNLITQEKTSSFAYDGDCIYTDNNIINPSYSLRNFVDDSELQRFASNWSLSYSTELVPHGEYSKSVDLVLAVEPSETEVALAKKSGVELHMEPIALDAFVFLTDKSNPVDDLTLEQIRDIYAGKITNWKQVGGKDEIIVAFQRNETSGSQTAMKNFVMKNIPFANSSTIIHLQTMSSLVNGVAAAEYLNSSHSIGYSYRYYTDNQFKRDEIKYLKINGVAPTDENILNGSYPLNTKYYGVTRHSDEDGVGMQFLNWIVSKEGQQCVKQAGYIPVYE